VSVKSILLHITGNWPLHGHGIIVYSQDNVTDGPISGNIIGKLGHPNSISDTTGTDPGSGQGIFVGSDNALDHLVDADGTKVEYNIISNVATTKAIQVAGVTTTSTVDVTHNQISGSKLCGLHIQYCGTINVNNNTFSGPSIWPVVLATYDAANPGNCLTGEGVYDIFKNNGNTFDKAAAAVTPAGNAIDESLVYAGCRCIWRSIQDAIDDAHSGDSVEVLAGTYTADGLVADIYKSDLTLKSTDGPEVTIIQSAGAEGDGAVRIRGADDGTPTTGVTVDGFTVYNTGTANSGAGILLGGCFAGDMEYPASGNTVKNCVIGSDTDQLLSPTNGVYLWNTTGNIIQNNIIYQARNEPDGFGCGVMLWGGLVGQAAPSPNNQIIGNEIYDSDRYGVFIGADDQQHFENIIIRENTITGNGRPGIGLYNILGSDTIVINFNNIHDNTPEGVWAYGCDTDVDAAFNWWGDETGPDQATLNPGGQGNAVSANVNFSPWLYELQEEFVPGAPCYAGSVVLDNEATEVGSGSYAGGWNTFSTPILLDSSADSVDDLLTLIEESGLSIVRLQRFDPVEGWVPLVMGETVVDYQIKPGEGFFIQVSSKGSLPILCSTQLLPPQSWELSQGWNLVGAPSYENKRVEYAFSSLGTTCTVVNSPGANPESWSYPPAFGTKELLPGRAYWVAMSADGTLMCSESTPVADDMTWELNQ